MMLTHATSKAVGRNGASQQALACPPIMHINSAGAALKTLLGQKSISSMCCSLRIDDTTESRFWVEIQQVDPYR